MFAVLAGLLLAWGCTDEVPTVEDGSLIPVGAETVEILLPFSDFARDFQVFGGFASVSALASPVVAREFRGDFESRALVRFQNLPGVIQVRPPGQESTVPDSAFTPIGGRLIVRIDTLSLRPDGPVEVEAGALLAPWHLESANWEFAVDTLGDRRAWEEPGGGPVRALGSGIWRPDEESDSLVVSVDSLTATEWVEGDVASRSARFEMRTSGALARLTSMTFQADVRSSVDSDTIVTISADLAATTFVFTPDPGVAANEIRIGGAPSRRAFFRFQLPSRVESGSPICQAVQCPLEITADRIMFAGLVMETLPVVPAAFQPADTLRLDVRPALAPDRIPRSPLGRSVQAAPRPLAPSAFQEGGETRIEIPMTGFIQSLLQDPDPDDPVPTTVALLSPVEPTGFTFASLAGPGMEGEPFLRLILSISEGVQLP